MYSEETEVSGTAQQAKDAAKSAGESAQDIAGGLADSARDEAHRLADTARDRARTETEKQTGRAAESLRTVTGQMRELSSGTGSDNHLSGMVSTVADRVDSFASRIDSEGLDGLMGNIKSFARTNPVGFLGASFAAGFALSRIVKNVDSDVLTNDTSPNSSSLENGDSGLEVEAKSERVRPSPAITPTVGTARPATEPAGSPNAR